MSASPTPVARWRRRGFRLVALLSPLLLAPMLSLPGTSPARATEWCTPTTEHPYPVVLLPGTWANKSTFDVLRPRLDRAGYCTFVVEYGRDTSSSMGRRENVYGTAPVVVSARQTAEMLGRVRQITGADKVSLVTHSQGGLIARLIARSEGASAYLDSITTIASTANGTTALGAFETAKEMGVNLSGAMGPALVPITGQAALDQMADSPIMKALSREYNTVSGVRYLSIVTADDVVATPAHQAGFFDKDGPAATVWNIDVKDCLPAGVPPVTHTAIVNMEETYNLVTWALNRDGGRPKC